jgi:thiol:disulfide interchange protein
MSRLLCLISFLSLFAPTLQAAETLTGDHVKVSWIAPSHFNGETETIGVRFEIEDHWHIYWKNPGDSGTAPKFNFTSESATVGATGWPTPKRFPISGMTNIGYEHDVVFPFAVTAQAGVKNIELKAELEWLVCKEECLPGSGELTLNRPIDKSPAERPNAELLDRALQQVPKPGASAAWSIEKAERVGEDIILSLNSKNKAPLSTLQVFPIETEFLAPAEPKISKDGKSLRFAVQGEKANPASISFLLADATGAWEVQTAISGTLAREVAPAQDWTTYLILLLSAFVGGIILNLMPCVLPVLSIKFFSLAKVSPQTRFREAMLYTLGVLLTFTGLGALFLALRAGGAAIGWGFQLQSPPIVTALIVLFFVMGLSFLGFFEFGNSLTRAAGKFENTGAFATGCLSVFVATPCTGPFMGTALGAAATLPAIQALVIFFALGLGLASPFLALAFFPKLRLPRPGNWMIVLRQVLAFPLFATVIWLLWVLGMQLGSDAWLYITSLGLLLSFSIWLAKERSMPFKIIALLLAIIGVGYTGRWVISAPLASKVAVGKANDDRVVWMDYDKSLLQESAANKQAVFVDFTASWCVTCQVNKKAVLETEAADKIFAANNVRLIRGDWTNLDDKITTALAEFDRASVPLYLFYPADGGKPQILPQILQLSDIESLFTANKGN